jgi:hypothetical protein
LVWAFVIVLVLLIPILAIVLDSQVGQALANRISRGIPGGTAELAVRIETLEADVRYLTESMESLREETDFVRSLIESPDPEGGSGRLPPGGRAGRDG